jgi:hypothetical protein
VTPDVGQMRVKPKAKRVEMTVPLDVRGENYDEDAPEALKLKHLTLQSRPGHLPTSYALGSIRFDHTVYPGISSPLVRGGSF